MVKFQINLQTNVGMIYMICSHMHLGRLNLYPFDINYIIFGDTLFPSNFDINYTLIFKKMNFLKNC
jgi:hypothetical protein